MTHPAQRFKAPGTISKGTPLKTMFDADYLELLAESFAPVVKGFPAKRFVRDTAAKLESLELKARADAIAEALRAHLPTEPASLADVLLAALGPKLERSEDNGLAPFFYMPHASVIRQGLVGDFAAGMRANYELTMRFTAEFSVRPFLLRWPQEGVALLRGWCSDSSVHVRRLVSEGTRTRLPWAERLPNFIADPTPVLPLLEALKHDDELYVRRSVANHIGDLAKDHLELALAICERWLDESESVGEPIRDNTRWLVRHAIRHPAKKGHKAAVKVRKRAGWRGKE